MANKAFITKPTNTDFGIVPKATQQINENWVKLSRPSVEV